MRLTRRLSQWWTPGALALGVLLIFTGLPLLALLYTVSDISLAAIFDNAYYRRVIRFSFVQALLSASLSTLLAIPVARALSQERTFVGRSLIVHLYSMSLVIPTLVTISGIVVVYGRTGWLNSALSTVGIERFSLYGLTGILIAHVFFNMPLASRIFLQSLENIPSEQWRLATQLRMPQWTQFRFLEWPAIRKQMIGVFMLIFMLCFTSFAIVLTLGGGPRATTIEVAIYQAVRFDFDLNTAVTLALIQLLFCGALLLLSSLIKFSNPVGFAYKPPEHQYRTLAQNRWLNAVIIASATLFVLLPLFGLLLNAINPATLSVLTHSNTVKAVINTIIVSLTASVLAVSMGVGLLLSTRHLRVRLRRHRLGEWLQHGGNLILVMPPIVLSTGLFLLLRPIADVFSLALILAIVINSIMALPFVLRILDGPMMQAAVHHDRLIQSLNMTGLNRWRWLDWPLIKKPFGYAMAVSAAFTAGDLSAIALFGSERALTLPLLLYQRIGSYRLYEASVTAALLLMVCLLLFIVLQSIFGYTRHART